MEFVYRPTRYILNGKMPVPCEDFFFWGIWMDQHGFGANKIVEHTFKNIEVSTIFLGMDASPAGPPMIFETAILVDGKIRHQRKSPSWDIAVMCHYLILPVAVVWGQGFGPDVCEVESRVLYRAGIPKH